MRSDKPEGALPSSSHYDDEEAARYTSSSHIQKIQTELAERCLELLELPLNSVVPPNPLILDIGCGSGISGDVLTAKGIDWVGVDVSYAMLQVAQDTSLQERGEYLNLACADIGTNVAVREAVFDSAISVSVVQWLCHSFMNEEEPKIRLRIFFQWLYNSLIKGGRAVLQFYASNQQQTDLIGKAASQVGFNTYFIIDHADSIKKKKVFLILTIGVPTEAGSMIASAAASTALKPKEHSRSKQKETHKEWIVKKKEKARALGKEVKKDSKYTARKRKDKF